MNTTDIKQLKASHSGVKDEIESRLDDFNRLWKEGCEEDIFAELVFCLLTPQSKAKSCWGAVQRLRDKGLLLNGSHKHIAREIMHSVRFHNTKAERIVEARKLFVKRGKISIRSLLSQFEGPFEARDWLAENLKGLGYKEASHFLRNIGMGEQLAILDRHILKNLVLFGVIDALPKSLSRKRYLDFEEKMSAFADSIKLPMAHLDLLLWYKESGEVFK